MKLAVFMGVQKKSGALILYYSLMALILVFMTSIADYGWHVINLKRELKDTLNKSIEQLVKRDHAILDKVLLSLNEADDFTETQIHKAITYYYPTLRDHKTTYFSISLFYISSIKNNVYIDQTGIYQANEDFYPIKEKKQFISDYYNGNQSSSDLYVVCQPVKNNQHVIGQLCITDTFKQSLLDSPDISKINDFRWFNITLDRIDHQITFDIKTQNKLLNYVMFIYEKSWFYAVILWLTLLIGFIHYRMTMLRQLKTLQQANESLNNQITLVNMFKQSLETRLNYVEKLIIEYNQSINLKQHDITENRKKLTIDQNYFYSTLEITDIERIVKYFYLTSTNSKIDIHYRVDTSVNARYFDVFLLQRLLMSLMTESVLKIDQNGEINLVIDLIDNAIKLTYSDTSYGIDFDAIEKMLLDDDFFIPKALFNELIAMAHGSMYEISTKYQKKELEITLPSSSSHVDKNIVYLNRMRESF
ncbi:hypothetical protein [Cysteiniphilum sp. 6C5]|uniref:hypothetical protein n=1 Tax=unclassified Cysteiniphilum TaxID=2610889 RepID=UPI003F85B51D